MKNYKELSVGQIVAENIEVAQIFQRYGIDFCCGGDILLTEACKNASAPLEKVVEELESNVKENISGALDFNDWSLDLLVDYVVKYHHHYIRTRGPEIYTLLKKVVNAHGDADPHLHQVESLFAESLVDLGEHLMKEENILFPLVDEILTAKINKVQLPQFHCGSVENPIRVMMQEHDDEGVRFREISKLTNAYTAPSHACNSYKLLMLELQKFERNLHIHIHVENNILFPKSIKLQESF